MTEYNSDKFSKPLKTIHDLFDLSGRIGIITGGSGKMGEQFVTILVEAGATVIIADIDKKRCQNLEKAFNKRNPGCVTAYQVNVSSEREVHKFFECIDERYEHLDFLVHNVMAKPAGYYRSFEEYNTDTWDAVLKGNLTGAFLVCKEAVRRMRLNAKGGSIVLTSSIYGIVGPDQRIYDRCTSKNNIYSDLDKLYTPSCYSASKAGLIGFSRYLATMFGKDNIRVNVLTPGGVFDGQEQSLYDAYRMRVPLARMAEWSDYNGAILFMVSDASRYMTGANLIVDGGWTAW
ncbi:MAG: SDR family oxidoreductase [bacterium]